MSRLELKTTENECRNTISEGSKEKVREIEKENR
jgi:hypothetical protein